MDLILNIHVLAIFYLTTSTAFAQVPTSGCHLITKEDKCFSYFSHSGINWTDARASCQTWGGDLASIANAGENAALDSIRNSNESGFCWIGLNDIGTEGTYVWSDGSNSSYRNWESTEPNNEFNEDCVNIYPITTWNDLPCSNLAPSCYYCNLINANLFGRTVDASTFEELNNNTILSQNTTLYCVTENRNTTLVTWSYVNLDRVRSIPISATNNITGVSLLELTNDNPGIYSCQVTRNRENVTYIAEMLLPGLNVPSSGCDLITNENKCFSYFTHSGINWTDARANCQTWGGDLASIADAGENAAVDSIRTPSDSGYCWIGLNDIETEETFVWSDDSNSSYRNWNSSQPDNTTFGIEDCVTLNPITWNDLPCNNILLCYYCSLLNVSAFGRINNVIYTELPNNHILSQNTTLYCISENNTPWSYVDLAGNRTSLNTTVINAAIGITLSVTTNNPGYYSCQVIQSGGLDETYTVGIFNNPSYTFFIPGGNTENRVYTIVIDREEVFLFCKSSNSSISLTDIKWRITGNDRTFPNPLIPHSNMLLQSGTSYNIQCVDIRTNSTILSTQYTVQGPPVIALNNGSIQSFSLLPPNINSASVTVLTQNVVLSTNLAGRWQRPDNSSVSSNTLTFSTFYVTQGGEYKFYVDNWDGQQTLAIQINIALEGLYDQSITSIRTDTSSPTSILVSWILLYNQTANSNETFSVYYSTAGGAEVLAGTTSSLFYNITGLLPNVEYSIRIEVNLEYSLIQTFSLQTFHLITIPNCQSPLTTEITSTPSTNTSLNPMTTETISTSTELPISSNFQFTPEIGYTIVTVSIIHILLFTLLIIIFSAVFFYCRRSKKRDDRIDIQRNAQTLQAHVNPANADNMLYEANEHVNKLVPNPYGYETNSIYMDIEETPKSIVETQVSYLGIGDIVSDENPVK